MAFVDEHDGRSQVWVRSTTDDPATQITFVDQAGLEWTRWSPRGGEIYFNYGGSIWSVLAVGGAPRNIVPRGKNPSLSADGRTLAYEGLGGADGDLGIGEDRDPQVSLDGRRLIYTNVRNSFSLELLNASAGRRTSLATRRTTIAGPRFSPSGDRITFFHETDAGTHLWTFDVDGNDLRQITSGKGERNILPRWSAKGDALFFRQILPKDSFRRVSVLGGGSTEAGPWPWNSWVELDASERAVVYNQPDAATPKVEVPAAPGGLPVADSGVTIVRQLESGLETTLGRALIKPRWSPDGKTIFGTEQVRLADRNSSNVVSCDSTSGTCHTVTRGGNAVPSPDGRSLYFTRPAKEGMRQLCATDVDGRNERCLGEIGPFRLPDIGFDVSREHLIVWPAFHQGRPEI
jgi:Tol biopolymer transport system component